MQKTNVGNVSVVALVDNIQAYPLSGVYPALSDPVPYRRHLDDQDRVSLNFGCFLAIDGNVTLLVDTGWGPEYNGRLLDELREAGVAPSAVTHVLFTHLHGDHTGWNIDRATGKPVFENAEYLVPAGDWRHYSEQAKAASFTRDVVPLEATGRMRLIEGELNISPALTAIPTPGHTPGHTSVAVSSGGEAGFILGDVVISPIDATEPTLVNTFDCDSAIAEKTRLATLERLTTSNALVGASHLPAPGLGHFVATEGKRYWRAL